MERTHSWRAGLWRACALASLVLAGCHKEDAAKVAPPELAPPPPADHLAPGELVEGKESAFGLVLPNALHVEDRFDDVVYATGPVTSETLANYVRARVTEGKINAGAAGTIFDGVRVTKKPDRVLMVHVQMAMVRRDSRIEIRDVTPPPVQQFPDEPSHWKSVGLSPDGKILDPTHLQ